MNKINLITIGALVFAVIALGFGLLIKAPIVNVQPVVSCPEGQSDCLGAMPGATLPGNTLTANGITTFYERSALLIGTSTTYYPTSRVICWLKTPSATSTLVGYPTVSFKTGTTTASIVEIGLGANYYSTTTLIGAMTAFAANVKGLMLASSTSWKITGDIGEIPPNYYFVVKQAGGKGYYSPTGTCGAVFQTVN